MHRRAMPKTVSLAAGLALVLALATVVTVAAPAAADQGVDPDAPTNVRVTDLRSDAFTVEWDGTDEATYYQVKLYHPGASTHFKSVIRNSVEPATFTGLLWSRTYSVVVTAVNTQYVDQRRYADSERLDVRTEFPPGCGHPSAPLDLRPVVDGQGRVETIRWDASVEGCSALTYRLHADGVGTVWSSTADMDVYRAHLYHLLFVSEVLDPGATYTFRVTATDIRGNESAPTDPVTLTMPTELPEMDLIPPSDLRVTFDDDGLVDRLEWDAATGGTGLFTYRLNYRFGNEQTFGVFFTVGEPFVDVQSAIGPMVECPPTAHPANTMVFRITALSGGHLSAPTNEVAVCFP